MGDCVIRVENLGKLYRIGASQPRYKTIRESFSQFVSTRFQRLRTVFLPPDDSRSLRAGRDNTVWALRNVSFQVNRGEVIGIIGRNGAGKSTLLKILSRVTMPTEGAVDLYGRVGSLLEVGTGFHPELTGCENIFLNGALLGMRKAEIDRKFDEIVAFADVERFLDTPVKHYSSGMYVRLAFAVAAHLEQEILLVDEVLAVGDAAFQQKCLGKMGEVAKGGRTVVLVSHNMAAVQSLCGRVVLLNKGEIVTSGNSVEVVAQYLETLGSFARVRLTDRTDRQGTGKLRFVECSASGVMPTSRSIMCGAPASVIIRYEGIQPLQNVHISMAVYSEHGQSVLYLSNDLTGKRLDDLPSVGAFVCRFEKLPLLPGTYTINLYSTVNGVLADWVLEAARIHVAEGDYYGTGRLPPKGYGSVAVNHEWDVAL
jgi:lipopolysaccharide transport system ATP-binding protein